MASRHNPDLILCKRQVGVSVGTLCDYCDGRCPYCDSHLNLETSVFICDECFNSHPIPKCIICGANGTVEAKFCRECTLLEKDRDGCVNIIKWK